MLMLVAGDLPRAVMTDTAAIDCEREFLAALRARREALGVSFETLEALAGMPSGYASKLLTGARPMGALTLWLVLGALGLRIRLEEDPEALERNRRRTDWQQLRRKPRKRRHLLGDLAKARRRNAPWLWDSERARDAARMRWHPPAILDGTPAEKTGSSSLPPSQ